MRVVLRSRDCMVTSRMSGEIGRRPARMRGSGSGLVGGLDGFALAHVHFCEGSRASAGVPVRRVLPLRAVSNHNHNQR